jgi:FkbM family methyltransferase
MITTFTARMARTLQARFPQTPIRGLSRLADLFPETAATVTLPSGVVMALDSALPAHRELLFRGVYQPALTHLLRAYAVPGAHCLDVGANVGFYALDFARRVGSSGRVAAFEANPALADLIEADAARNGFEHLRVERQAVFHSSGQTLTFYVAPHAGKSSLKQTMVDSPDREISVQSITLDDYLKAEAWPRLDVLKIDIEGADADALMGAQASIARFRPVVAFEFKRGLGKARKAALREIFDAAQYRLETVAHSGQRAAFDWHVPDDEKHLDVLCLPL